jgi:hypothetical protein
MAILNLRTKIQHIVFSQLHPDSRILKESTAVGRPLSVQHPKCQNRAKTATTYTISYAGKNNNSCYPQALGDENWAQYHLLLITSAAGNDYVVFWDSNKRPEGPLTQKNAAKQHRPRPSKPTPSRGRRRLHAL